MIVNKSQVARSTPFDPTVDPSAGFTSQDTESVIYELYTKALASSSPGFTWGRSGAVNSGAWLLNDSVPSNKAGRTVTLSTMTIAKIFSASEDLDTYTIEVYEHQGNEIGLTLLTTLAVTASRSGDSGTISIPVTSGRQLAAKVATGSAKNIVVGLIIKGNV